MQSDGRLVHRCEMRTDGSDSQVVVAANMQFMMMEGPLMAGVSYLEGHDPVVQLVRDKALGTRMYVS